MARYTVFQASQDPDASGNALKPWTPVRGVLPRLRAVLDRRRGLAAFLIPLGIRAIPEILVGPYPVDRDAIAFYVPNTLANGWAGLYGAVGKDLVGNGTVGTSRMDEKGRVLIPLEEREKVGLKPGVELEIRPEKGGLLLKPLLPPPVRVKAGRAKWGREAFLHAGEATFGE